MEFVFKQVKSYIQNIRRKLNRETSVSFVILLSAMFLIAGAAYAADVQSPRISPATTTMPVVTRPPVTQAPSTAPTTTTPKVPDITLEQWGSLYVHMKTHDPAAWHVYATSKQAIYGNCGEWHDLAITVGWPESEWPTLSRVMFRESRCNWDSHNKTDPHSGSRGLLQINGYWCRKSQYSENGWLQDRGILTVCDDLYNPTINLKAGLAMWQYGEDKHGCGWRGPWVTPCS